jgi:hypothetical protein
MTIRTLRESGHGSERKVHELCEMTCPLSVRQEINQKQKVRECDVSDKEVTSKCLKLQLGDVKQKFLKSEATSQMLSDEIGKRNLKVTQLENQLRISEIERLHQLFEMERLRGSNIFES